MSQLLWRLGLPRVEETRYELARWYDLLIIRTRAAVGTADTMDLYEPWG
jgi:hypothetical protein